MIASQSAFPKVKKFLLCIDLKTGVLLYIIFEMSIWALLSFVALENESEFFHNYDLYLFEEHIDDNFYYQMMFGSPVGDDEDEDYFDGLESAADDSDGIDIEFRLQCIAINGIVMLIFICYLMLSFIYLAGLAKENTNFFIPYFVFDIYIIWMAFISIIAGLFTFNFILVRNCSIFVSVKLYPAICNYSLFRKLDGKFEFTREVPQRDTTEFQNKRKSFESKKSRNKIEENHFELETLNKKRSNKQRTMTNVDEIKVIVNNR